MKKIFTLWFFVELCYIARAQTITITNHETDLPIDMVSLVSEIPRALTTTNVDGQADISVFKGSQKIKVYSIGYKTEVKSYIELEALAFKLKLLPLDIDLEELVVSATRWNQTSNDVPSKIISISTKEVMLRNPQTAADLLGISGKIFIQKSQQGGGSPMIRGFATNRLLYTVDGVRMNTAIFRGGNIQNVISLDPFAMEKTEVLFGPGSVIYGSDAIGGVMAFQTLNPKLSLTDTPFVSGKALIRYASANKEKTGHFDIQIGWKKWAIVSSFSTNDFEDLRMGSFGPDEYLRPFYVQRIDSTDVVLTNEDPKLQKPSAYAQINMMQKVRFAPSDKWDFQYGFHYSETSNYSRYDRHIRYRDNLPRYGEWYYGPQKWMMNNLNIIHIGSNPVYDQVVLRLAHQFFEESRVDRDINEDERHIRIEKVDAYSANLDFVKSIGAKNKLFYGIEIVHNNVMSSGINEDIAKGVLAIGPSRYPQSTWASYGAYLSEQFQASDKFLLQMGVRYNQFLLDAKFDTTFYPFPFTKANLNNGALTGSLGVVYKPTTQWAIAVNAATAFRSPNVDDIGKVFDSEPGTVTVPNPNLKAEYAYNIDLSITKIFGEVAKIDATLYYTILENALVKRNYSLNGQDSLLYDGSLSRVQAMQNAAMANVYGLQAGIELKIAKGCRFSSDFNYQVGEEELDDGTKSPSRHAPPLFGASRLSYSVGKLYMEFYVLYSGKKKFEELAQEEQAKPEIYAIDNKGNPWSPDWYTLNFKAMYQFKNQFVASMGIENLSDQRYRSYSSGISAPGRNFILSFRASF